MNKILIVDDEQNNLYLLQELLTSNGYEPISASNGAEALELAHQVMPDAIISDILMPVMDGFGLCRACKEDERLRDVPFIFYTASYTDARDEELALSLGAERVILKPTESARFLAILRETLEIYAAGKAVARYGSIDDLEYYKEHAAALIRKLEDKVAELEGANRQLELEIVGRKKTEEALRQSENNYASLVNNASVGVYQVGLDGTILFVNQEIVRIGNFESSDDLIGSNTLMHYKNPEDHARLLDVLKKEKQLRNFETELLTREGEPHTVLLSATLLDNTINGMVIDITDRKQMEESLREIVERFETAFESAPVGMALLALDSHLLRVNRVLATILGYSEEELLEMSFHEITHPDDLDAHLACDRRLFAGEFQTYQSEQRCLGKNQQVISVLLSISLVRDKSGQPLYLVLQMQDMTELKRTAVELHHSVDLLNVTGQIARVGGWELFPETQTLNWTEEVYRIHEVDPDIRPSVSDAINFFVPEAQPVISAAIQACTDLGTPWDLELQLITAKDRLIWVRTQGMADRVDGKTVRIYGAFQDITERKEAEILKDKAHSLLSVIGKIAHVGGWDYDLITGEASATEEMFRIHEMDPVINPSLSDIINIFPPERRPDFSGMMRKRIDDRSPWKMELPWTTAKGRNIWVNFMGEVECKGDRVTRLYGAMQDITERREMEETLRKSEERYRLISTVASDYMYSSRVEADGKVTQNWVAGAFEAITGYTFEEYLAHGGWRATIHPDDLAVDDGDMEKLRANQSIISEIRTITKSGQTVWVRTYAQPVWDAERNQLVGIYGAVQDVTERVLSENSLHESNERFRQLVRKLNAVVWSASLDGSKLMDYNQSFERIYGTTTQELESNPNLWLELVHPEDRKIAEESTEKLFKDGETNAEYRIIRPDGSVRWILDQTSLLLDKEGKPIQMGGIATDITEQKHVIAEIRQQTSFAEALATSASIINSNLDLDSMLNAICKETAQALSAPSVVLRLYDQESQTLQIAADYGLPAEFRKRMAPIHLDPNQSELSPNLDAPTIVPDIQSVPDHPDADLYRAMDLRTVVVTKILAKGKLIGSLTVISLGKERLFSDDEINLLKRLSDQAAQAITNVRYLEDIEHQLNKIKSLHLIDSVIANSTDIRLTLKVIIEEVIRQLGVDAVSVLLYNPESKLLEYANGQGFRTSQNQKKVEQPGEGLSGSAVQGRQMIHIPNLADIGDEFSLNPLFDDEGFVAYYGMPLIAKGQVIGVMEIFHRASLNPNNEWLNFLETLAGQTAIAIDSAQSFENLQRSNEKLVVAYDATIEGWSRAMDLRDHETEGHSRRVAQLTLQLAQEMGISDEEMVHMRRGALLHDIGKLGIPDSILLKPSKLTEAEWKVMRQHPQFAYDMLSSIEYLRPAVDIPYYHHEKWDGSGYPQGLAGEQIPLAARIFAVVDVWDALTSDRPYRPAFSKEKALEYMREQAGRHFDADILRKFLELLSTQTTHGDD